MAKNIVLDYNPWFYRVIPISVVCLVIELPNIKAKKHPRTMLPCLPTPITNQMAACDRFYFHAILHVNNLAHQHYGCGHMSPYGHSDVFKLMKWYIFLIFCGIVFSRLIVEIVNLRDYIVFLFVINYSVLKFNFIYDNVPEKSAIFWVLLQ